MKRLRKVFYGWWIVAASFGIIAYGGGAYWYGFSVFFKPIQNEFGWTRAETSAAFSLASLEGGVQGPIVGPLVDRFGPRRLMFGSDYPPVGRREGYRNALFGLVDHLSYLKREELEWVFGQTALSVWNFPDERVP